jgi:uncharacterized protein (TIGR01777 family)
MRVFLTGGSGFVGSFLMSLLVENGHEVTVLSRSQAKEQPADTKGLRRLHGDPAEPGPWQEALADHGAVVNLAGQSIFRRWTPKQKERIRDSRILTTRNVAEALRRGGGRGKTLLSASGAGFYGFRGDEPVGEDGEPGHDFLARLSADWEREALAAGEQGVRVALCRFGIVLGRRGGALDKMVPAFRMGLGSPLGTGKQWFPWIHERDLAEILLFLLERSDLTGPVNCTAPSPVTNREFTKALAAALGRPAFLPPVPEFALRWVMGEFGDVLLQGQRALPVKLMDSGFSFRFPTIREALADLTGH